MEDVWRPLRLASLILFFLLEKGAHLLEGGVGLQHGDEGLLFLELVSEANEEGVDEGTVVDVITKLTEFVADGLDPLTEDGVGTSPWVVVRSSMLSALMRASELSWNSCWREAHRAAAVASSEETRLKSSVEMRV